MRKKNYCQYVPTKGYYTENKMLLYLFPVMHEGGHDAGESCPQDSKNNPLHE